MTVDSALTSVHNASHLKSDAIVACCHYYEILTMRTTLNLSEPAIATARRYAAARSVNLGQAVSDLIVQAERRALAVRSVDGVWVADLPSRAKRVTAADVDLLLANE